MKYREAKTVLFLLDARGIYIPRDFADAIVRDTITGIDHSDLDYLSGGPDQEYYWDTWADVCDNAIVTSPDDGTVYRVYQDGDCWLVEDGAIMNDHELKDCDLDTMFVVELEDAKLEDAD